MSFDRIRWGKPRPERSAAWEISRLYWLIVVLVLAAGLIFWVHHENQGMNRRACIDAKVTSGYSPSDAAAAC